MLAGRKWAFSQSSEKCYANIVLSIPLPTLLNSCHLLSLSPFSGETPGCLPCVEEASCTLQASGGLARTSGCAGLSIGPGQAVETRGRDANGGTDLLPLDGGPGVHLRHIFQVPGTEADSVLDNEAGSCWWDYLQHQGAAGAGASRFLLQVETRLGPRKPLVGDQWLVAK